MENCVKVFYRFPSEDGSMTPHTKKGSLIFYLCRKYPEIIFETERWLQQEHNQLGIKPEFHEHFDVFKDRIHFGMSYDLPESIALLFRLKFGMGSDETLSQ